MIEDISGKKISGEEYKNLAIFYAFKLQKQGIKKGDSIVIFIKNIIDFSAYSLAVLLVGAKLVIIEPDYSEKILEEKLKFIKPDLLIIEGLIYYLLKTTLINKLNKIKKYFSLIKYSKKIIIGNYCREGIFSFPTKYKNITLETESLVVFTGGTTGKPKGVVHTLESLEIMFNRISKIIGNDTKIFYADLPHFVLIGISMGLKIIVGKNDISDEKFLNILQKYKIDTTFSPPYRYLNILNNNKKLPKTLKHICLGSAPIYKRFLEKVFQNTGNNTKITCIYGMTELLPISFIDGKEKLLQNINGDLLGKVFNDINIKILGNGELEVYGLFKNYLGGKKIKKHQTGDLVEYKDGNLIMKGRLKDMILRKDYNIYPSLYEGTINSIPGIIESAIVGIFDEDLQDEKVILFLEGNCNKKVLALGLEKSIDKFAFPDDVIFLDKIPRIGRQNKIDKNYLRKNYRKLKYSVDF
ncbi:MAG: class I adenylate-forming enzyme family protein [Candidatus Gracilibacteria bacterium]|nr:class I adenylate-forming enzyme family protein [Candidatus Gracilibacteria bacterium]